MYLRTLFEPDKPIGEAIDILKARVSNFAVPNYDALLKAERSLTGLRSANLFNYIAHETGVSASPDEVHEAVVRLTGRAYAGLTGIIDSALLINPTMYELVKDKEIYRERDYYFDGKDGSKAKIWKLGADASHFYYPHSRQKSYMHAYTFLEIQAPTDQIRQWRETIDKVQAPTLNMIRYPVFVIDHDMLQMLSDTGLLPRFEVALNKLMQTCSHDFLHHYFFPSPEVVRDKELSSLVGTLCINTATGREQKNIEHLALMLNLGSYLHTKDTQANVVFNAAKEFLQIRDELLPQITDDQSKEAARKLFNSVAVLMVSGFVPKEDLLKTVDGDIGEWKELLKDPKHKYTPGQPIFTGYKDPKAAAELRREDKDIPKEMISANSAPEIAAMMMGSYSRMLQSKSVAP